MAKSGKNKARNQVRGKSNAPWFNNNVAKRHKKNKQARISRRRNR